jgi:drug/metabolite transporter (DMT)-like permease
MMYYKMNPFRDLAKKYWGIVAFRAVTGFTVFAFFVYAITLMPLALYMVLVETNPFWTSILCLIILKEQIKNFEFAAMMICFGGVACIALAKDSIGADFAAIIDPYADTRVLGIVIAIAVAWGFAGVFILNRKLQRVHWVLVMFFHSVIGFTMSFMYVMAESFYTGELRCTKFTMV